mgnify:CR=1 FL=1
MKNKEIISCERKKYLRKIKIRKGEILTTQIFIVIAFIAVWEILARRGIIDSFIASQPSRIVKTFMNLSSNNLLEHLKITCEETLIGFGLGSIAGVIIAIILWWSPFISKVSEPFLVVLNSLPKVALRTNNYYLGWSRNASNYCYGSSNFFDCNNIRKPKWLFKN